MEGLYVHFHKLPTPSQLNPNVEINFNVIHIAKQSLNASLDINITDFFSAYYYNYEHYSGNGRMNAVYDQI